MKLSTATSNYTLKALQQNNRVGHHDPYVPPEKPTDPLKPEILEARINMLEQSDKFKYGGILWIKEYVLGQMPAIIVTSGQYKGKILPIGQVYYDKDRDFKETLNFSTDPIPYIRELASRTKIDKFIGVAIDQSQQAASMSESWESQFARISSQRPRINLPR